MSKYEDTVMAAIKELEEKPEDGMEVDDTEPTHQNPTKKPEGIVDKLRTKLRMK